MPHNWRFNAQLENRRDCCGSHASPGSGELTHGGAQALNGSVVGTVKDSTDAMVAEAVLSLRNAETGQARQVVSDSTGAFNFATVQPGTYEIRANKPGFSNFVQTGIVVSPDAIVRVDVALRLGEVSETVTVQSNAAVLQTDSGEVRHQLDSTDLSKIPVPVGRNYQSLLSTMPGFTPPTNNHSVGTNPSRALYFAVNGGDHYQNNTRIDGATTMNVWLPDIVAMVPTLESIATVNISTNSFDAETGFTGGANIGVQTKSGANQTPRRDLRGPYQQQPESAAVLPALEPGQGQTGPS